MLWSPLYTQHLLFWLSFSRVCAQEEKKEGRKGGRKSDEHYLYEEGPGNQLCPMKNGGNKGAYVRKEETGGQGWRGGNYPLPKALLTEKEDLLIKTNRERTSD